VCGRGSILIEAGGEGDRMEGNWVWDDVTGEAGTRQKEACIGREGRMGRRKV